MLVRPQEGTVRRTARLVHLVQVPDALETLPDVLTCLCGRQLPVSTVEWLDGIVGAPCTACLMRSPTPAPEVESSHDNRDT